MTFQWVILLFFFTAFHLCSEQRELQISPIFIDYLDILLFRNQSRWWALEMKNSIPPVGCHPSTCETLSSCINVCSLKDDS